MSECPPGSAAGPAWSHWGWAMAGIWLAFLIFPVINAWEADAPLAAQIATLVLIGAFAVTYLLGFSIWTPQALWAFAALVALAVLTVPVLGFGSLSLVTYVGAFSALQVPEPYWRWTTPVVALVPLASLLATDGFPIFFFVLIWPIVGGCVILRLLIDAENRAEGVRARLALVAERERVARDVHDVLGHSLTALSVKAELAERLIDVDPERARAELLSIQETARQALAEVRATVGGLRAANLAGEVAAAPEVLADAGLRTTVTGEVADTDPRHRTLLAWVLREATTNVLRHAEAGAVSIELTPSGIVVADDGRGVRGPEGNGLRGMRERVEAAGGTLTLTDTTPGTRLEVRL